MELSGRTIVVTGAASGIGRALARRFAAEGAKLVACADRNGDGAKTVAAEVGGLGFTTDVGKEADIAALIETVESEHGAIDLFLLQRRHRHRRRGRGVQRGLAADLGHQCDGPRVGGAASGAADDRARRRVSAEHRLGGRTAVADRFGPLCRDQARRRGAGRMAGDHPRRSGDQRSRSCARRRCARR